jgi:hypothetical protein
MAKLKLITITLGIIAIVLLSTFVAVENSSQIQSSAPKFFVGVEVGWLANVAQCKAVIDQVKNYTNLLIIASPLITGHEATLNETCDYATNAGMYVMAYFSMQMFPDTVDNNSQTGIPDFRPFIWMLKAKERYNDHFLGVYFNDEAGGQVLDSNNTKTFGPQPNYSEIANIFIQSNTAKMDIYKYFGYPNGVPIFTSDYGLYWFDYKSGFDVVLAQFGWNNSRLTQIALTRGAAKIQNKDWGAIITWTYNVPPYLESGAQLYEDLVLAYNSGARYAAVYDAANLYANSTLTKDHYNALKEFWSYIQQNPDKQGSQKADTALVLPQDYGFGFRSANDSVWGIKPDPKTAKMYADVQGLLREFGSGLDIVYGEAEYNATITNSYDKILTWTNGSP